MVRSAVAGAVSLPIILKGLILKGLLVTSLPPSADSGSSSPPERAPARELADPTGSDADRDPAIRDPFRHSVIAGAILLVAGPIGYFSGRAEIARWHHAAGYEQLLNGDLEKAIGLIDNAIEWDPHSLELITTRANWKTQRGTVDDVLPDCHRAVHMARVAHAQQPSPQTHFKLATTLNQIAYTRALASEGLDSALAEANEAISILGDIAPELVDAAVLDTLGYIEYLRGDYAASLKAMLKSVHNAEREFARQQRSLKKRRQQTIDPRPVDHRRQTSMEGMAVLYHHLGLVYQKLGQTELAKKNLALADKFGYDPASGVW